MAQFHYIGAESPVAIDGVGEFEHDDTIEFDDEAIAEGLRKNTNFIEVKPEPAAPLTFGRQSVPAPEPAPEATPDTAPAAAATEVI